MNNQQKFDALASSFIKDLCSITGVELHPQLPVKSAKETRIEKKINDLHHEAIEAKLKNKEYRHMDWRDVLNDNNMYCFQYFDVTVPTEVRWQQLDQDIYEFAEELVMRDMGEEYEPDSDSVYDAYEELSGEEHNILELLHSEGF